MPAISKSQLKRAIVAAERARLQASRVSLPVSSEHAKLLRDRRAEERRLASFLQKTNVNLKQIESLRKQDAAKLRGILEREQAAAIRSSRKAKAALQSTIDTRVKAIQQLVSSPPPFFPFPFFVLNEPVLIWATPHSNTLRDSHTEPWNNWAKFNVVDNASNSDVSERLSFYFLWRNPSDYYAAINAMTYLSVNGHCQAYATGSYWSIFDGHKASIGVLADFTLWDWWIQPSVAGQVVNATVVPSLQASAGLFDDTQDQPVSSGYDLSASTFLIPPQSVVLFEVGLSVSGHVDDGQVWANFADGDWIVSCPFVAFSLLTQPVMSMRSTV